MSDMTNQKVLSLEDKDKSTVLDLFGKDTDEEGYIIEKRTGKRLEDPYQDKPIHRDNFSIMPGSAIFVRSEPASFAAHRATHWEKG